MKSDKTNTPKSQDANLVGKTPGSQEVEQAVKRVKRPAKEPVDRTAEHLLQESDVTKAAIPNDEPVR
jgi:hypothetical protein